MPDADRAVRKPRDHGDSGSKELVDRLLRGQLGLHEFWESAPGNDKLDAVFAALVEGDVELCQRLIREAPDALRATFARQAMVRAWADQDPIGCYHWIRQSELADLRRNSLVELLVGQADRALSEGRDPDGWLMLLKSIRGNRRLAPALEAQIAEYLGASRRLEDAFEAMNLAGPLTSAGVKALIDGAVGFDLPATTRFLSEHPDIKANWIFSGGGTVYARARASKAPAEAFAWSADLQQDFPQACRHAINEVMQTWLPLDAQEASKHLATLPPGFVKDAAIESMGQWLHASGSKEEIRQWLDQVRSEESRARLMELLGEFGR